MLPQIYVCLCVLPCMHARTFILVVFLETPALGGVHLYPPQVAFVCNCLRFSCLIHVQYMCLAEIVCMLHSLVTELVQLLYCTVFESSINTLSYHKYQYRPSQFRAQRLQYLFQKLLLCEGDHTQPFALSLNTVYNRAVAAPVHLVLTYTLR